MLTFVPDFMVLELGKLNLGFYESRKENYIKDNTKLVESNGVHEKHANIVKSNRKSYLNSNYQTWSTRRHKNIGDMQVVKCSSYRDVAGSQQRDISFTLSTSSSYMSDSTTTTNASQCDTMDHQQQCRHLLLDESSLESRGSSSGSSDLQTNSVKSERKINNSRMYDPSSRQHTPTLHEIPDPNEISICFSESA